MQDNTPDNVTTEQMETKVLDWVIGFTELLTLPEFQKCDQDTILEMVNSQKTAYYSIVAYNLQLDGEFLEQLRHKKREQALSYFHSLRVDSSASGHSQPPSRSQPQHYDDESTSSDTEISSEAESQTHPSGDATECEKERTEEVIQEEMDELRNAFQVLEAELREKQSKSGSRYDESSDEYSYDDNPQFQSQDWETNEYHFSSACSAYSAYSAYSESPTRVRPREEAHDHNPSALKQRKIDFNSPDNSSDEFNEEGSDATFTSTSQAEEVAEPDQLSSSQPNDAADYFEDELVEAEAEINALADKFATYNGDHIGPSHPEKPMGIEVRLVRICQARLAHALSSEKFDSGNLHFILDNLLRVLKSVDMCRQQLLVVKGKEVALLKSIPSYSDLSRGDLLTLLSKTSGIDFRKALSTLGATGDLGQAIEAISGGASTKEILKEISICPMPVRHLLNMLAQTSTATKVLAQFTVEELGSHLHESHKDAARLYKQFGGRDLDRKTVNALELLEVAVYYLKKGTAEDRKAARYVAIWILDQVTMPMNPHTREKFEAVAPGYFDDSTKRKETLTFLITLLLADEIEAKAPPGLFAEHGGFLLRVLDLSWSDAAIVCRKFASNKFFTSPHPEATFTAAFKAVAKKTKRTALKKVKKSKLVIFNQEQMESLQALARLDG